MWIRIAAVGLVGLYIPCGINNSKNSTGHDRYDNNKNLLLVHIFIPPAPRNQFHTDKTMRENQIVVSNKRM